MTTRPALLIVDDDPDLLDALALTLEDEGFEVWTAPDGQAALELMAARAPDLILSDVNMPRLDGFSLCRRVRERDAQLPLILLTSRDHEIDEALGLELGADDYIFKPFSARVLVARVRALLRRGAARSADAQRQPSAPPEAVLCCGELRLELDRLEAYYQEQRVTMTVTELRLLEVLVKRPGLVYTRAQLLDKLRGDDTFVAERLIDTYIRRLRRKLEAIDPSFDAIETIIGAGYRWRRG